MRRPAAAVIGDLNASWIADPGVEAVLLFGSYAHGVATERSDIDLYVIVTDGAAVPGDGLYRVEGYVVEAFVNTRTFFEGFFPRFHADHSRIGQTQFATSRVLFDRNGEGAAIQATAREWIAKPRVRQAVEHAYWPKRIIWSRFERLAQMVADDHPGLAFALHGFVYDAYAKYAAFVGQPTVPSDRLVEYLTDAAWRARYMLDAFPDEQFADALRAALRSSIVEELFPLGQRVETLALDGMGGFEVLERVR